MKKFVLLLLISFFSSISFSQEWERYADSAAIYTNTNYQKALDFYFLEKQNLPADSAETNPAAFCIHKIGNMYLFLKNYTEAEKFYLNEKKIREKLLQNNNPDYAAVINNLANVYKIRKEYEKSEAAYRQAKIIWEKALGKEHNYYILACNNLASLYMDMKLYEKAEPLYLEVMQIKEKTIGKENTDFLSLVSNLASLYWNMQQNEKAEQFYLEAKQLREKLHQNENSEHAIFLNTMAFFYEDSKQYLKAEPLFLRVIQIRKNTSGTEDSSYVTALTNCAFLYYYYLKDYSKAAPLYLQIKQIKEKTLGRENAEYINAINFLGGVYEKNKEHEKAKIFYNEQIEIQEKLTGKNDSAYASALLSLANLYQLMDEFTKSEQLYLEGKTIWELLPGKKSHDYMVCIRNLASLYKNLGRYEKAEALYLQVLQIYEQGKLKDDEDYAFTLNGVANLYHDIGQYEKSLSFYLSALDALEKISGKQSASYSLVLNNLGIIYKKMKDYTKAESSYLESLRLKEKLLGKMNSDYAITLDNLAIFYLDFSKYNKAEPLYLESLKIKEKVLGKEHSDYALALNNLGVFYRSTEQYEKAEPLFVQAKRIWQNVLGKQNSLYGLACVNLARIYWLTHQPFKADEAFKEYFAVNENLLNTVFQFTSEKEKTSFIKNVFGADDEAFSFYVSEKANTQQPYSLSLFHRNLILSSSQQLRKAVSNSKDTAALGDYKKWMILKKELAALLSKGQNDSSAKELEENANLLEKKIARTSSEFKKQQTEPDWKDIQKSLNGKETAIEFVEYNYNTGNIQTDSTYYIALVLRKDKAEPILVPLFAKKQLDSILQQTGNKTTNDNVKSLYASRGVEGDDAVVINKSLYKLIWGPLENELKGINTVYFAPAGLLHRIAFAALPVNDKEVLSDKYKLIELSTTANIINQQPAYVSTTDKINLYGGIKYNVDTTALKISAIAYHTQKGKEYTRSLPDDLTRGGTWNDLPGTKTETDGILSVANNKNNISVLSGIQATEESIKALDGKNSPVVLHIATHGFFFPDPKKDIKDNSSLNENGKAFKQSDDPLFRSGLLFAGANNSWNGNAVEGIEDGILTSYEVSNMYLPNTKLVVLSACETGLGDIQGAEGVYGLQRAFKMAGVENLVMSLWKVPDVETAEFMQEFYKNMFAKQTIADAFYHAQTTMKNKYRSDPYKWAAWVLVR